MIEWSTKTVLVTGGNGFLGSWIVDALKRKEVPNIITPTREECDLTQEAAIEKLFSTKRPHIVIHAAALFGSVRMMAARQGDLFYQNTMMNTLCMEYARRAGVERYMSIGSGAVYPENAPLPYREEDMWSGPLDDVAACYGFPKKVQLIQTQTYKAQYNFHATMCIFGNLYGPRDHFDAEHSTVIPSMIQKFVAAKKEGKKEVVCWGDGSQTRDVIYVEDAAEAVLLMLEKLPAGAWVNCSNGTEISVKSIAEQIKMLTGFDGTIVWDITKGIGQKRRWYDITQAKKLGFVPKTDFAEGLKKTVDWYLHR